MAEPENILAEYALKEWSAAIHALLDGRQTILLRKGGIHEKRFTVAHSEFLLFPTSVHSHAERVRPESQHLIREAQSDSTETSVVLRAAAKVVAAVEVNRPENLEDIEQLHIWTAQSVREDRLDFRPKHRLTALVVQAIPLLEPIPLTRTASHAGCASWVQVSVTPALSTPVHSKAALADIAAQVRHRVG